MVLSIIGTTLLISGTADHPVRPGARYFPRARITVRARGAVTRIAGEMQCNAPMRLSIRYSGQNIMWAMRKIILLSTESAIVVDLTNVQLQQTNREFFLRSDIFAITSFI